MKQVAILLSRQSLHPTGKTGWVSQVKHAVEYINRNNYCLISSVDTPTYELTLSACSKLDIPVTIVVPAGSKNTNSSILHEFALDEKSTNFINLHEESKTDKKQRMQTRDRFIIGHADILFPISIRDNGLMKQLILDTSQANAHIDRQFQIPYCSTKQKLSYRIDQRDLNHEMNKLERGYIYHWTRTTKRKWPGERQYDFYKAILESESYPRSAFSTLIRMLYQQCIIGSQRHMPKNCRAVSYSSLHPTEALSLMKWRSRYGEMSFEPYGIGIRKEIASVLGVVEVSYYDLSDKKYIDNNKLWYYQSNGRTTDWRTEQEYRSKGDFPLHNINRDDIIIITRWKHEADEIQRQFGFRSLSMIDRDNTNQDT